MTPTHPRPLVLLCAVIAAAGWSHAQTPTAPSAAPPPVSTTRTAPRFTNLKAYPKDIEPAALGKFMRQYEGDLGVECEFCHAARVAGQRPDRASDANPTKDVARYMITMTADLNTKYLAEMPDRRYADPITCGTCHRGEKHPSVFAPTPRPQTPRPLAPTPTPPAN